MKHVIFNLQSLSELDGCIEKFRKECPETYSSLLISVFTHWNDRENIARLTSRLAECLPAASIVGSTSSGGIVEGNLEMHTTVLSFMVFHETRIEVHSFSDRTDPLEKGERFLAECKLIDGLVGIEFLATLKTFNVQGFFGQLSDLPLEVEVFGGGADTYEADGTTYVFTDEVILDVGMVAVCFAGPALSIQVDAGLGWRPLGTPMKITATHGNLIVRELDHRPAVSVYEKYLKIYPNEHFKRNILEFPLVLEREGVSLARLPDDYTEDGSLVFNADCHEGEYVRLAYGDSNEIVENTQQMQDRLMEDAPEAILIFSCVTRRIFLQDAVRYEICRYQDIAPVAGWYTHGEIDRKADKIQMLNMTLVTAGFREGPLKSTGKKLQQTDARELSDYMSLAQRLSCFITVTSRELEAANRKLTMLACQDRLTGIFNRGEIETRFKEFVREMRELGKPTSAIMMDLDNFKSVNDVHGHEMGDVVLQTAAKILRRGIRSGDIVGRWGGEEFLAVLPGANLDAAVLVAERIRKELESTQMLPDRSVTGSFGVAEVGPDEEFLSFYQRLDELLYTAKHSGKNCVVS